jgi:hypothetical protein
VVIVPAPAINGKAFGTMKLAVILHVFKRIPKIISIDKKT